MIRMLHTADWHLDAPLRNFTDLQRRELRASLLELPGKVKLVIQTPSVLMHETLLSMLERGSASPEA